MTCELTLISKLHEYSDIHVKILALCEYLCWIYQYFIYRSNIPTFLWKIWRLILWKSIQRENEQDDDLSDKLQAINQISELLPVSHDIFFNLAKTR